MRRSLSQEIKKSDIRYYDGDERCEEPLESAKNTTKAAASESSASFDETSIKTPETQPPLTSLSEMPRLKKGQSNEDVVWLWPGDDCARLPCMWG
eukprot:CAMPEP_0178901154 /NCGR_PEP_ID=MMETSP0786-20121207/3860_1 /TAXON_ID=186022 /ORGANISM="Thalassionema frauenfeldii, Strain CCMP 1798" /LENGTH=94 /DNA_ID=CAMNT_0020572215 /DNA_START=384 /DNA_END=668 /DNA_ORIENTATION=-